jgi:hypothetical protein
MSLLLSQPDYERWLYAIPATYVSVRTSTLRFFTTSAATATVAGSIFFHIGYELRVSEVVDFAAAEILDYGYEVWLGGAKIYWLTRSHTPMIRLWPAPLRTTSMCRLTSNIIVSQPPG